MHVVIFRARIRQLDADYSATAARLRELALTRFGCLEFHALSEGDQEVALSYWPDEASIRAWRADPEHIAAQQLGRERWYADWSVQVAEIGHAYRAAASAPA
jgi:heme-degrading monooxygenase HmoA